MQYYMLYVISMWIEYKILQMVHNWSFFFEKGGINYGVRPIIRQSDSSTVR